MKKSLYILICFCLILFLFVACAKTSKEPIHENDDSPAEPDNPIQDKLYEDGENASFLKFKPVVTVRDGDYEILITLINPGTCMVVVGEEIYTGIDNTDDNWNFFKIRIPQSKLDAAKEYAICYISDENQGKPLGVEFEFKPIEKTEGINIYVTSDVHLHPNSALREYEYLGDNLDLVICNGDFINTCTSLDDIFTVISYYGEFSNGRYPVIFARGNHEYASHFDLALELIYGKEEDAIIYGDGFAKYILYLSENGAPYYEFSIGPINGVVIDTYDKDNLEKQTEFLTNIVLDDDKIKLAITHLCPVYSFEEDTVEYEKWNTELNKLGIDFMICGHYHSNFIIEPNSSMSDFPNNYPVICGNTMTDDDTHSGIALTLYSDKVDVSYVFYDKTILSTYSVNYKSN